MNRKLFLLLMLLLPLCAYTQTNDEIPVKDGKVVFSETILTVLKADEIKKNITTWLEKEFLPGKGKIITNDSTNNLIVCRINDYLEMEKTNWKLFALHMRYMLVIECKTNQCIVTVKNIAYIEPDNLQTDKDNIGIYTAESVLIENKYKEVFIEEPIKKIKEATIDNIDELFFQIRERI